MQSFTVYTLHSDGTRGVANRNVMAENSAQAAAQIHRHYRKDIKGKGILGFMAEPN